jgi:hypothetical protein
MTTLAEFTISASRLLDPAGKPAAPLPAFAKDIAELVSLLSLDGAHARV